MNEVDAAFRLDGKVVVVMGALRFLGLHYTAALANAGAHVVVADVDDDGCRRRAEELTKAGLPSALGVGTDVSRKASVDELVARTLAQFGRVDVPREQRGDEVAALHGALRGLSPGRLGSGDGGQPDGCFPDGPGRGAVVGPDFRIYPDTGISTPPVYTASKAGVIGLTRYLATYWAGKNIRVNCLSPGGVYNDHAEEFVKNYSSRVPLGRMAEPEEMGWALVFLASDASSYLNGHNLVVDGGWTAW